MNAGGNVLSSGTFTGDNFIINSQRSLKKDFSNIRDIKDIGNIDKINLKRFRFKDDKENRLRYGVIAEELEKYFPEMVYEGKNKTVAYLDFLIAKVARLEQRLNKLENEV